jgi:serine/threonine protein kinase
MKVIHFSCGQAANESELRACAHVKQRLEAEPGNDQWILLSNLAFSVTHQLQSDEIDLVVIGPPGVRVVEVKHWTAQWADSKRELVEQEAVRVTNKAKKIGTTLRKGCPSLPRVDGAILLTQEASKVKGLAGQQLFGVWFHSLNDWKTAIQFDAPRVLSQNDIKRLAHLLEPKSPVAIDGSLRRLAGYVNLELQTPKAEQQFHRVYKGAHPERRDRVVLHLYDLSASDDKNAEAKARREFEALHRLQIYGWAPRILDSYQRVPGYEGEMYFFTIVDPVAPCLADRSTDANWKDESRVAFARNALRALREMHAAGTAEEPIVHRNLTPQTVLVKHDNTPIFTGFERAKIPSEISVASSGFPASQEPTFAPEVRSLGLAAADQRSDVYSICDCLSRLFQNQANDLSRQARKILARGLAEQPHERETLDALDAALGELLGESVPPPPALPARFWTEDQVVRFRDKDYRIVARLGSGGVGTAFKVVEIDGRTKEELGTYVAKVVHDRNVGERVLRAYALARPHLRHPLSTIFEVAKDWQENQFVALMRWVRGAPLSDFIGVFPLLAEEQQEPSSEALAVRWLRAMCDALDVLHGNGLVHGDVSPGNLILSDGDLVLTDYDFVGKLGEPLASPGTLRYCAPSYQEGRAASRSDDLYALAASFFHVLFEREPFGYGQDVDKRRGLNWQGIARDDFPILAAWLDRATDPDPQRRFASAEEAKQALAGRALATAAPVPSTPATPVEPHISSDPSPAVEVRTELREERVPWLQLLLQSYPGSRWGNRETRGLDTDFASETYVGTQLEEALLRDIRKRRVRLVILCGNAGDGKTALLQHLADRLGLGRHQSSKRVLEAQLGDGLLVRMNLDGSASWQGRSADEILDEFLAPFQSGPPAEDIVHLLAINDGRLLEWIERVESLPGGQTELTAELRKLVQGEVASQDSHIRFVSLNQRSLVGGIHASEARIETGFLERLIDQLYGGAQAPAIWAPCQSCSAKDRCEVFRAAGLFGPSNLGGSEKSELRERARQRLFEALQAVHLRGETHTTVRELRATLVYILFGTHFCDDYHEGQDALPYWDRAFQADSPSRQGEVLTELARFDPALEAHPQIDRYLQSRPAAERTNTVAPHYPDLTLESARRRAFFEWTRTDLEQVAGDPEALGLARGRHLRDFRDLALKTEQERAKTCERLCRGISRLEDLPPQALERQGVVPLRVTPRTPTETAFWVEKPLEAFRLEVDLPPEVEGIERLHRHVFLVYRYRSGAEERLRLGADLFHLLLELADGYQLGDVSTDDTFAHLSIFVQHLAREDERVLLAWNPMQDETLYKVEAVTVSTADGPQQRLVISPL